LHARRRDRVHQPRNRRTCWGELIQIDGCDHEWFEGHEAIGIWAAHGAGIDLVICDVAMAQVRGPELMARLAARGAPPRVLFMTGYGDEAVRAELGHRTLAKPFTSASLLRAITDALG
jgi:CheY-like chemotaxis protein